MGALCTWRLGPVSERPGLRWPLAPPVGTLRPVMASPWLPGPPFFPFRAAGWLPMLPAPGASCQGPGREEPAGAGQPQP